MQHLSPPNAPRTASHTALPYSRPPSPRPNPLQIGFVGLGNMGYPMARNLANYNAASAGSFLPLLVWNRSVNKTEALVKEVGSDKAHAAKDLDDMVQSCDIVITNLANDEVVKSIYQQFAKYLTEHPSTKNKIFAETSTVYPKVAGELDELLFSCSHVHFITSQVIGAPAAADKAHLLILLSGDYRSKKEVAHIFVPAIGHKVIDLGGDVVKAPTFKLIANSLILGNLEILAEAFTMADKSGIEPHRVLELVQDILPAPPIVNYANKIANGLFDGSKGFSIDGGIKDASHIRKLTEEHNSPMPVVDIAHQHLLAARALYQNDKAKGKAKFETLDWSGLVAGTRVAAGLSGFDNQEVAPGGKNE
ncbi:hypothetical protein APHAL10511_005922 [Amanita phalloides]|nr:hypothetical protein APHAL10511_005922 [Amanita phalloides]